MPTVLNETMVLSRIVSEIDDSIKCMPRFRTAFSYYSYRHSIVNYVLKLDFTSYYMQLIISVLLQFMFHVPAIAFDKYSLRTATSIGQSIRTECMLFLPTFVAFMDIPLYDLIPF